VLPPTCPTRRRTGQATWPCCTATWVSTRYGGPGTTSIPDEVQRINYDTGINGRVIVEGRGGNDAFFADDTTVIMTLDGGAGDDMFQIGQIFGAQRNEADGNLLAQDVFPELVATTRGWLSPGSSSPLVAQGGTGNDEFRVYSNQAELRLEGDDDNDLFIVRAFALAATTDFDWNDDGTIDKADLDAGVAIQKALFDAGNDSVDINDDGGINYLDLFVTPDDTTDDVIVLDEDGVATPQIGSKFSVAQAPDIRTGGGQDEVRYNVNAPVSVDGGTGFDKLVILGTEFADDIVIRKDGIFGAGLNVRYDNIEVVEVDGLEGDDEFFVLSTAFGVSYRVIGGLGSDTINVGGDVTEDIITRELEGASGTVDHLVTSSDPLYNGLVVDGFDYNVARDGEGLVVINEEAAGDATSGWTVVREESINQYADFYTVRLAEELTGDQVVYVTVSAALSPQEERTLNPVTGLPYDLNTDPLVDALGDSIWLSTSDPGAVVENSDFQRFVTIDGVSTPIANRAITFRFDKDNWDQEQTVYVFAPDDLRSEGERITVIQHSVISNVPKYDAIDVRNVEVTVHDNDTPGMFVTEIEPGSFVSPSDFVEDGQTLVIEGTSVTQLNDEILLKLAMAPTGTVVVDIVLNDFADKAIQFFNVDSDIRLVLDPSPIYDAENDRVVIGQVTFDSSNWDDPVLVGIQARDDYVREDLQIAVVEFEDANPEDGYDFPNLRSGLQMLDVEVVDNETSGAVVLESGTGTQLIPDDPAGSGENDTYTIRLTREPDETVRVAVLTDGLADVVRIDRNGDGDFLDTNETVTPNDYAVIGGLQATQMFNGNIIFGDNGTNLTLTRGTGSDQGNFIDEGFFGESLAPNEVYNDTLTFDYDGSNLALISTSGDFTIDFAVGDTIRVSAPSAGGFDANNNDYEISAVTATQITLTQTGTWTTAGTTTEAVSLSEFVPVEGQRIRIGGSVGNDGDYQILSISEDGQTIVLTATTGTPWTFNGETDEPIVLSDLAENTIFEGTVNFGEETDPDLFPGQFLDLGLTGKQEGWLADGFLEGMWVRITDLTEGSTNSDVEAKIQLIRGDNDSKDAKLQLINVQINDISYDLSATWLGDAIADNVQVVRIAPEVSFTSGDYYVQQTVELAADVNYIVPPMRDGVKIFPVSTHLLSKLRGPLAVEGGPAGADRSLTAGVKLPGEKDDFLIAIGAQPPESQQIDVLNIYNDSSQADTSGVMDQTTLRGFGMADDLVFDNLSGPLFGEGADKATSITIPGGISYGKVNFGSSSVGTDGSQSTIEVVNLMLGQGNDYLDIQGTLDPAPFVSAQNVFDFYAIGEDPDAEDSFDANYTVRSDSIDWKAEGFLPRQIVTVDGVDGVLFEVVEVADAIYLDGNGLPVDDGDDGYLRDPNDNSILVLKAVNELGEETVLTPEQIDDLIAAFADEVRLVATDDLVLESVTYDVAYTTTGGILTRTDGEDWEDHGFIEGHLINIGGENGSFSDAVQYRVLSIVGDVMEVLGDPIASASDVTTNIWVQGPHGSLTMVHGGGNLPVQTTGDYETKLYDGQNILTRLDGRSWQEAGYRIGQLIQIGDETETRTIDGFGDADVYGVDTPDGAFATWGTDAVMILSGDDFGETPLEITGIDLHRSVPLRVEVEIEATLIVDTLTRASGDWTADGFEAGDVVYIEGIPGGFTVQSVTATELVLEGAAISECVIDPGSTITVIRIDVETDAGAYIGGDHFVIGLAEGADPDTSVLAGPNSPLVVYGDTSQDGVWYSGHSYDRLGQEFGDKLFDPFANLTDEENEDDEWVFPLANPYTYAGNDIIDARGLFADYYNADGDLIKPLPSVGFTAYGGAGNDLIYGSQAGDHLAGGSGDDIIYGQGGTDHIYGDSGVNVDILTRALTIPTVDASPAPTVDPLLGASDQTFKPVKVATPMRDDMAAGNDFIDGNDSDNLDLPNIIFGDHGVVVQYVDDPNLPPILLQKIQTTELSTVLEINSAELQNGGDDILYGDDTPDILIGGAGHDMIDGRGEDDLIFGDNVYLTRMGDPGDTNLIDDILNARFQTLAGTLMYSRTDREVPEGVDPLYAYAATGEGSLTEDNSGRLLTDGIARNYRDPNGPQWWAEYEIDYADLHTFAIDSGSAGVGSFGNDFLAGGAGNDEIFGQLGHDVIQGDGSIDDAVAAIAHVGAARNPGADSADPDIEDPVGPLTVVASFEEATDGQDYIEGGGGLDVIFGGLGQDDLVGGSSTHFSLVTPNNRPDRDDFIFGGAGTQIDRNNGFDPDVDSDPEDGQYGEDVVVTIDGTSFESKHGRDSDAIVGDNGDIIRIVGVNGVDVNPHPETNPFGQNYVTFNYDTYGGEKIVVRGIRLLDYTMGGPDFKPEDFSLVDPSTTPDTSDDDMRAMFSKTCDSTDGIWTRYDIGGHDEIHGETGDDFIYLGGGCDIGFGDADNDDLIGGWGNDWISGGTGQDGILGDDGRIFTSRNTSDAELAESIYGVEALIDRDPDTRTSQGNVLNELIHTPGNVQSELINVSGELKKSVDLTPFNLTDAELGAADPALSSHMFADDILFGGLGNDFMHGGSGDDAIAGGEALSESYAPRIDGSMIDENGQERDLLGLWRTDFDHPYNPGNALLFGDDTNPWNGPKPVQSRLGEFYLYDEYDPRRPVLFDTVGGETVVWTGDDITAQGLKQYFLNQASNEGVSVLGYVAFKPDGQTPDPDVPPEYRQSDGDDAIFGDLGNDWIVGGTGRDHIYGGFGNDLMNADDVIGTVNPDPPQNDPGLLPLGGYDETPDTHWAYEDRVFGGAGLDILIGNTKGDRLIDWVGEFNSFIVPFASFGVATVSRQVPPHLFDFLYAQAFGDGVDITRTADTGQDNHNDRYSNVALLQGGIYGEIGLVTQKDHGYWQDQTGGPTDPQAGNVPGGRRDVLRTSDFNNASMDLFVRDTGKFEAVNGRLYVAADSYATQATAFYNLDAYLPIYYEVRAMLMADKPLGGAKANAYIIFDYQSDIEFKYAGINVSTNQIEMGYRDATGWHQVVKSNQPVQIKPGIQYDVLVAVNGTNVTLIINGVSWFTYTFDPRLDEDGLPIPLNKGFVGVAMDGGSGTVDNFTVQILPPEITLEIIDDFSGDVAQVLKQETGNWALTEGGFFTGIWSEEVPAVSLADLGAGIAVSSILELEASMMPGGVGGLVFDYYDF